MTAAPHAVPAVVWPALLVPVLFVAAGAVAVRDLLVAQGWLGGTPWTGEAVRLLDGADLAAVPWWASVPAVVVGLLLLLTALRPARTTHRAARDGLDLWLTPDAVAAMAHATADRVNGVVDVESSASRTGRRVRLLVHARSEPDAVRARVAQRLADVGVDGLVPRVRLTVRVREVGR
ncbi:hypothetical protein KLP28_11895 [Nocardioidaceae bacterium]|nr:hypothetical protein KLP28_11895 [Nocardioidaceae bacterium]